MPKACVANLDNITPLPKSMLVERAGRLSRGELPRCAPPPRFAIGAEEVQAGQSAMVKLPEPDSGEDPPGPWPSPARCPSRDRGRRRHR